MFKRGMSRSAFFLAIAVVVLTILSIYFNFFFHYSCDDLACFKSHQAECVRTRFIHDTPQTTWLYEVGGKRDNKCVIDVTILQIKEGRLDRQVLEGKTMKCSLDIGSIDNPEGDLTLCHGRLKEDIQELIIRNTHSQIVSNLDDELAGLI